jgi:antirestriction protein ArdC
MPLRPAIKYGGDRACYSPTLDQIKLPKRNAFKSPEEFYCTAFHELAHASGHSSRLGRKGVLEPSYFGSHDYSQEELVAEFGASMLCGFAGIEQQTLDNSAAYIQGWLKVLRGDKKLAIIAAGQAQLAADYILNRQPEHD